MCAVPAAGGAGASLVFMQLTNWSVVQHSQLLRRVFCHCQDDLVPACQGHNSSSVYIVTDVGPTAHVPTLRGLLGSPDSTRRDIRTQVYAGAKPMFSPISCVVICLAPN